jgi:hypothetical protein
MRSIIALIFFLLAASAAGAQTPLDWSTGTGHIQMPTLDQDGDPVPQATAVRCEVRVAGATILINSTSGSTVPITGIPKGSTTTAASDCEWTALLPGVRGLVATASVMLRPWKSPRAPTLQP